MIDKHRSRGVPSIVVICLAILIIICLFSQWLDVSIITGSFQKKIHLHESTQTYSEEFDCSSNCSQISPLTTNINTPSTESCPEYFRWIHEDLRPWIDTGITKEMIEKAKDFANIRIIIVNGRLYTIKYKQAFQTRDVITLWGILQLLRLYPGKIPDLDLMFGCGDKTVIKKRDYVNGLIPPPLFHYCGDESSYDIVFPDWSYWGWPEISIKPWEELKEELKEANTRIKWKDRKPFAYWKGNGQLSYARQDLLKCNDSDHWKAQVFDMNWIEEKKKGFKTSDLANQCTHRYKIYVEGIAWSVSQKYILACDSMTLIVKPHHYDFFTRSLLPLVHYWPINRRNECGSIKFAVEWGNKYTNKAQEIGKAGSKFIHENLAMEYVYDYSFHILNEYAKLLKYKPTVPEGAVETCSESLICSVRGQKRKYRKHSMVKSPANSLPCVLPPSYDQADLRAFLEKKENLTNQVVLWETSKVPPLEAGKFRLV